MFKERIEKAKILIEALPYIKKFYGKTIVIKLGGAAMVEEELQQLFASDISLLKFVGMNPVIVHGGGKEISRWMSKVGKEAVFIDGLRVTDSETMEITEMVLSGKINSHIVSLINKYGGKAVGISGKDANLFKARKIRSKDNKDLGLVGEITATDTSLVETLNEKGYIPVISSVAAAEDRESLNINADTAASSIAIGLKALKLIYLTDVRGILKEGELLSSLDIEEASKLLQDESVTGGMIPKLSHSIMALRDGVENVHIIDGTIEHAVLLEIFTKVGIGTMLKKNKE